MWLKRTEPNGCVLRIYIPEHCPLYNMVYTYILATYIDVCPCPCIAHKQNSILCAVLGYTESTNKCFCFLLLLWLVFVNIHYFDYIPIYTYNIYAVFLVYHIQFFSFIFSLFLLFSCVLILVHFS